MVTPDDLGWPSKDLIPATLTRDFCLRIGRVTNSNSQLRPQWLNPTSLTPWFHSSFTATLIDTHVQSSVYSPDDTAWFKVPTLSAAGLNSSPRRSSVFSTKNRAWTIAKRVRPSIGTDISHEIYSNRRRPSALRRRYWICATDTATRTPTGFPTRNRPKPLRA